jgi:hypothetical protein
MVHITEHGLIQTQPGKPEHTPHKSAGLTQVMESSSFPLKISLPTSTPSLSLTTTIHGNTPPHQSPQTVDSGDNSHSLFQLLLKDSLVLISTQTECIQVDADHHTLMPSSEFSKTENLLMEPSVMTLTTTVSSTTPIGMLLHTQYSLNQHGKQMMSLTTHSEPISQLQSPSPKPHMPQIQLLLQSKDHMIKQLHHCQDI